MFSIECSCGVELSKGTFPKQLNNMRFIIDFDNEIWKEYVWEKIV